MATEPTTPQVISNSDLSADDLAEIERDIKEIIALEAERAEINAQIDVPRKRIIGKGVPAAALSASLARYKMDPEQRSDFDRGRDQVDKALGIPIQADLFGDDDQLPGATTH